MTVETSTVQTYPTPLSAEDERTWAMLAHLSVLVNLFTGVLGPVIALIIYLFFSGRSKYVANHAMQSFLFQLAAWYSIGILWGVTGLLCIVLVGILLIPFACVLTPFMLAGMAIAPIYGIYAAVQVSQGREFSYWLVGDWVNNTQAK